ARTGVVQQGQKRMIALPFARRAIWLTKNRGYCLAVEVCEYRARPLFDRDAQHRRALHGCRRLTVRNEAVERTDRRESAVARADRCATLRLDVPQEREDFIGGEISERESAHLAGVTRGNAPQAHQPGR